MITAFPSGCHISLLRFGSATFFLQSLHRQLFPMTAHIIPGGRLNSAGCICAIGRGLSLISRAFSLLLYPTGICSLYVMTDDLSLIHSPSVIVCTEEQCRFRESKRRLPLPGGGQNPVLPDTPGPLHSAGGLLHPTACPHRGCHQQR